MTSCINWRKWVDKIGDFELSLWHDYEKKKKAEGKRKNEKVTIPFIILFLNVDNRVCKY